MKSSSLLSFEVDSGVTLTLISSMYPNDSVHAAGRFKEGRTIKSYMGYYPRITPAIKVFLLLTLGLEIEDSYRYFLAQESTSDSWTSRHTIYLSNSAEAINNVHRREFNNGNE